MKFVLAGWGALTLVSIGGVSWWARRAPEVPQPEAVLVPAN